MWSREGMRRVLLSGSRAALPPRCAWLLMRPVGWFGVVTRMGRFGLGVWSSRHQAIRRRVKVEISRTGFPGEHTTLLFSPLSLLHMVIAIQIIYLSAYFCIIWHELPLKQVKYSYFKVNMICSQCKQPMTEMVDVKHNDLICLLK